ncbi:MAG TPA: hypothetical protein VKB84_24210 [Candidatus Binataceae bacterium]|nr:hypothetical protein [Candidatus Binataceae bacterium]
MPYTAMVRRRLISTACMIGGLGVIIAAPIVFAETASVNTTQGKTVSAQPPASDPSVWVGRNISAVVDALGQPSYWNASHDGGGGGGRYIYNKPNQPHFVFETQPGGMIVRAARIP